MRYWGLKCPMDKGEAKSPEFGSTFQEDRIVWPMVTTHLSQASYTSVVYEAESMYVAAEWLEWVSQRD